MPSPCVASPSETGGRSASAIVPSSVGRHWPETICASLCNIPRGSIRTAGRSRTWVLAGSNIYLRKARAKLTAPTSHFSRWSSLILGTFWGKTEMAVARRASEHWQRRVIRLVPTTSSLKLLPVNSSEIPWPHCWYVPHQQEIFQTVQFPTIEVWKLAMDRARNIMFWMQTSSDWYAQG